ncbi:MAG: rod-binding protein [Pseudomonadota bacterium]|nr:rod-binding protein [Pseudomonadota bacterium]
MSDLVISGLVSAKPLSSGVAETAQIQKIRHTAQEFEAVLLRQMMREMRNSVFSETSKGGSNATYLSLADEQLANNMASQGGFGFGKAMAQQMIQQVQAAQLINPAAKAVKP